MKTADREMLHRVWSAVCARFHQNPTDIMVSRTVAFEMMSVAAFEHAAEQSQEFAEWIAKDGWIRTDKYYWMPLASSIKMDSKTTAELYQLFLSQINSDTKEGK